MKREKVKTEMVRAIQTIIIAAKSLVKAERLLLKDDKQRQIQKSRKGK